jgi:hypothetical protein
MNLIKIIKNFFDAESLNSAKDHEKKKTKKKKLSESSNILISEINAKIPIINTHSAIESNPKSIESGNSKRKTLLRIGLDFGTSFTKVIINNAQDYYVVSFKEFNCECDYLLPSVLYVSSENICSLVDHGGSRLIDNMKDKIVLNEVKSLLDDDEFLSQIICFLALVLRHTRSYFIKNYNDQFINYDFEWALNIGMPASNIDDEEKKSLYEVISEEAWRLSLGNELINYNLQELEQLSKTSNTRKNQHSSIYIGVLPECDALFMSFSKSSNYSEGHYILIDIGAGTTDVNYIIIFDSENNQMETKVVKSVENHGSAIFMKYMQNKFQLKFNWKRAANFPSNNSLIDLLNTNKQDFDQVKNKFIEKYRDQLVWTNIKARRQDSDHDRYEITNGAIRYGYFLTGGGANIEMYKESTNKFAQNLNNKQNFNLSELVFPLPELKPDVPDDIAIRLLVAYGLSWDEMDYREQIKDSSPVSTELELESHNRKDYIGNEQV